MVLLGATYNAMRSNISSHGDIFVSMRTDMKSCARSAPLVPCKDKLKGDYWFKEIT